MYTIVQSTHVFYSTIHLCIQSTHVYTIVVEHEYTTKKITFGPIGIHFASKDYLKLKYNKFCVKRLPFNLKVIFPV